MEKTSPIQEKVSWVGYLAFFMTVIFFSGFFSKSTEWWRVFDFTVLNGTFGAVNSAGQNVVSFRGTGGTGRRTVFSLPLNWRLR